MLLPGQGKILSYEGETARISDLGLNQRDLADFILSRYELKDMIALVRAPQSLAPELKKYRLSGSDLPAVLKAVITTKCTRFVPQDKIPPATARTLVKWALWGMDEVSGKISISDLVRRYAANYPVLSRWLADMAKLMR